MRTSSGELNFRSGSGFLVTTSTFSDFLRSDWFDFPCCDWILGANVNHSASGFLPEFKMSDLLRFDWFRVFKKPSGWLVSDFLRFGWSRGISKAVSDWLVSDFLRFDWPWGFRKFFNCLVLDFLPFGWSGCVKKASDWLLSEFLRFNWFECSSRVTSCSDSSTKGCVSVFSGLLLVLPKD